jgi:predicted AlkP superfamily pyrophosphatase or phosphodiesterase
LLLAAFARGAPQTDLRPTVILISLDGWRWDYHMKAAAPNLRRLIQRGVRAEGLIPSFPSKTFPNHYTLVTGLYPGHHGIVANSMRDPQTGRLFTMSKREEVQDPMWWGGEPIWVTLGRAGQLSAPLFWPGSEAPIGGEPPRYWMPYNHNIPGSERVAQVLRWLDLPSADRPTFLTLYFSEVDAAGHSFGPDSIETRQAMARADAHLGRLLGGLETRGLLEQVNVTVVSDHGMAATSRDRIIYVDDYLDPSAADIVDIDPNLALVPRAGRTEEVFARLVRAHPHLKVYRREETPPHWHYRDHPRVPPIIATADEGWTMMRRANLTEFISRNVRGIGGNHGYDPRIKSMHGIFVAAGPAFKRGVVVPAFENVHVYHALASILGVTPAPNDGDPAVARSVLREE